MTMGVSSASNSPSMMTLQEALEEAVLYFMLSPPKEEEKALKRVKAISDFTLKYRSLSESDSDDN